ncbi:hypothetical protein PPGU16_79420 (plasmid) [Paraburkholderia largidicola]|uniref:Uncharacterized protein n=1 Tax=Paraburkholderia largidicola TaxID=3014751 RepID=A0A7I8C2K8_9BURK|nr:hypothetical protein PPGU16_79420 [Paraburkholderia sp. PGU16]
MRGVNRSRSVRRGTVRQTDVEDLTMKYFFSSDLAWRYGYGMAVYIAAQTSDLQRGIEATNAQRKRVGRRLLEDATVEEIISSLRTRGILPVETSTRSADLSDADTIG